MHPETPDPGPPLERRLARLEQRLGRIEQELARCVIPGLEAHPAWGLALGVVALACGYLGLGLPQHPFQPLFAALVLGLGYHRRALTPMPAPWRWPQLLLNFLLLCLLFKLLIGGGTRYPLDWLRVPAFIPVPAPPDAPWYDRLVPSLSLGWRAIPNVSDWSFDLTRIQVLLLLATLAGGLFRFQPFASLSALALLLVSLPTYLAFDWNWVILFLIAGGLAFYLQCGFRPPAPTPASPPDAP